MQDLIRETIARIDEEKLVRLARSLVDIPSTTGEERECAEFLVGHMREMGLEARLQEITERRANAIGVLKGSGGGPILMFNGHLDTAGTGIEEEDYPAMGGPLPGGYKPRSYVKNGFIFGLGANNMKGGVAAAVTAIETLLRSGVELKGDIIMAGVSGESEKAPVEGCVRSYRGGRYQGGGYGTRYLVTHCTVPDFAVVCEPSGGYVINAQAGYYFIKITVKGRVGYQSTKGPTFRGINAIEKACTIIDGLRRWDLEYAQKHRYDSGMGIIEPHMNVGAIQAGWPFKPSYSSAICDLFMDLRVTPAMVPGDALRELNEALREIAAADPQLRYEVEVYASNVPATVISPDHYFVQACLRARTLVVGQRQESFPLGEATPYNDTNIFRQHGIPAVKLGPSGGKVPPDAPWIADEGERLDIENLITAARIYVALALDICTRTREEVKASGKGL